MTFTFRRSNISRLDLDVDRGNNFKAWLEEWSAYHAVSGLSDQEAETQYHVLRLAFSRDTATVIDNLGLANDNRKKVDKIIEALKTHIQGAVNETVERRNFKKRRQHKQESLDDFLVALRNLVKTCSYCLDACINNALRDQIIEGLQDGDTAEELLHQKALTLAKTIQICRAHEAAKHQREEIKRNDITIAATSTYKFKPLLQDCRPFRRQTKDHAPRKCGRCGKPQHRDLTQYAALDKMCNKCYKVGHFAGQCSTKPARINELSQNHRESEKDIMTIASCTPLQQCEVLAKLPKFEYECRG